MSHVQSAGTPAAKRKKWGRGGRVCALPKLRRVALEGRWGRTVRGAGEMATGAGEAIHGLHVSYRLSRTPGSRVFLFLAMDRANLVRQTPDEYLLIGAARTVFS